MQYGFMPGRWSVDAVFVLRRLTEKFRAKNKKLFFIFVDLEKAFDQVSREVTHLALVISFCKSCKTAVSVDGELSSSSIVKAGVHQRSALRPLLFIMAMDVLTEDVTDGSLMEFLYTDNLVFCGEWLYEVTGKYGRWKKYSGKKGLRVNIDETKGMQLLFGKRSSVLKVDPCCVCDERVGCNSIPHMKCQRWVHCHCCDVPRQMSLL